MCVERDDNVDRTKNSSLYQESSNNYKWMRSLKTQESSAYAQSFNIYKSILSYVHLIQFHQNGDGFYITSNLFHFWGSDCPKLHLILSEEVLGSSLLPGPQAAWNWFFIKKKPVYREGIYGCLSPHFIWEIIGFWSISTCSRTDKTAVFAMRKSQIRQGYGNGAVGFSKGA